MFQKFKTFWTTFWDSIKTAYNKAFKHPIETETQKWQEIKKINFLDIFVSKLNNLVNTQATFEVESDSVLSEPLKLLVKDLEGKKYDITSNMLASGDYYVFPATNENGEIIHTYLTQQQVRIINMDGDIYREVEGIIDWYVDEHNRTFFLVRNHKLEKNGRLTVSYRVVNEHNRPVVFERWEALADNIISFENAHHIGIGRFKSPASSRGMSLVYGVPLNFGCSDIEAKIFNDLRLIEAEFKNGKSVIFTDPRNFVPADSNDKIKPYGTSEDVMENIIPIHSRAGQNGPNIDIFNPTIRYSEHYSKLIADMALYEKQIGTSKGILTDNETSETATATAVKRANADTISLIDKIRTAIDLGNEMTLQADAVFLNITPDLWSYRSDWYDPFEDPSEQWKRLVEAKNQGAAETADLVKWLFPSLSDNDADKKLARINSQNTTDTTNALERMLGGA